MANRTPSQVYLSTRGGTTGATFEQVVLQGLAKDGGLFLPTELAQADDWTSWSNLSYADIALKVLGLYISPADIPTDDLQSLIYRSYSTFRAREITPLVHLHDNLYVLELFHGPSYSFKDCALQFVGNLFEYFLVRKNQGKQGHHRYHLTVVGATSGDTGSAAIMGLRGKKDVSVFIMHPEGKISPIQEAQMVTAPDRNVHNISVTGDFDDCQDIVKALFGDENTNTTLNLGAVNSINWARILAQIVYYFHSYFQLVKTHRGFKLGDQVRFVVPTGNFGNVLAGYFAKRMGLPIERLIVSTNENDILDRFWKSGKYEKIVNEEFQGVKPTYSPAMDILVSSNFERLMFILAKEHAESLGNGTAESEALAGRQVQDWFQSLKTSGSFGPVDDALLEKGRETFDSERVSDAQTVDTIKAYYGKRSGSGDRGKYLLDPHTAVGIAAAEGWLKQASATTGLTVPHIALSTAHPAKFDAVVKLALEEEKGFDFEHSVLPSEFKTLLKMEKRVIRVDNSWEQVRDIVKQKVQEELAAAAPPPR